METDDYEWDDAKAEANFRKHKVRFEHGLEACEDPFAVVEYDDNLDYGEDRFVLTGQALGGILTVIYTERGDRRRIISVREANAHERQIYNRAAQDE